MIRKIYIKQTNLKQKLHVKRVKQGRIMRKRKHKSFARASRINEFRFIKSKAQSGATYF